MSKKDAAIKAALPFLIESRDMLYEAECIDDGSVPDEMARKELARIDKVIDQCQALVINRQTENNDG